MDGATFEQALELGHTLLDHINSIIDQTSKKALQRELRSLQSAIVGVQIYVEISLRNCAEANHASRCRDLYLLTSWMETAQVSCALPVSPQLGPVRVRSL
jgi:hypothetical protein